MSNRKPMMGDVVLYQEDGRTSPAVVTAVTDAGVDLFLFPTRDTMHLVLDDVMEADGEASPGNRTWRWPGAAPHPATIVTPPPPEPAPVVEPPPVVSPPPPATCGHAARQGDRCRHCARSAAST